MHSLFRITVTDNGVSTRVAGLLPPLLIMKSPKYSTLLRRSGLRLSLKRAKSIRAPPTVLDSLQTSITAVLEELRNLAPSTRTCRHELRLFAAKQKSAIGSLLLSGDIVKPLQLEKILADLCEIQQLLSPITYLDDGILKEIFMIAFELDQEEIDARDVPCPPSCTAPPMQFIHVCQRWRNLAFSMPKLWCALNISLEPWGCQPKLELVELWLAKSMDYPLKVSVTRDRYLWQEQYGSFFSGAWPIAMSLLSHSARWQTLIMDLMLFSQLTTNNAPPALANLLESVVLVAPDNLPQTTFRYPTKKDTACGIWDSAPLLHRFSIQCPPNVACVSLWTKYFRPPLSQLERLDLLWPMDVPSCLWTLRECSKLLTCRMIVAHTLPDKMREARPVHLPYLDRLTLYGAGPQFEDEVFQFLEFATTPLLQFLTIANQHRWRRTVFDAFLKRSCCPIAVLKLINVCIPEDHLVRCLEYMNDFLIIFHLTSHRTKGVDQSFSEDILRRLSYDPAISCSPLCPLLQRLELNSNVLSAKDGESVEMIKSRWEPPSNAPERFRPILTVGLSVSSLAYHPLDITGLQALWEQGLQVKIEENCPLVFGVRTRPIFQSSSSKLKELLE